MTELLPTPTPLDDLRAACTGAVLGPDDPGHAEAARAWNVRHTHRPAVVVRAETPDDVAAAVRHARAHGMEVAVQTTGHGFARATDGGLLIDLSTLVGVTVDAEDRTARVLGGSTWEPVLAAASEVGLAPLLGSTPHVGAVGYTMGGGFGWLARHHGLAIDHVRSFELVTPAGEVQVASADSDPDLFWALLGGGAGGLGVVTAMTIELVPVTTVYAGNLLYPAAMADEVIARYAEWIETVPDELTSSVVLMNFPPFPDVPEPLRGQSFAIVRGCWSGPVEEGEQWLRPWREWAEPAIDMFGPLPFSQAAAISNDPVDPLPAALSTEWLTDLGPDVARLLVDAAFATAGPPLLLFAEVRHAGGAVARGTAGAFGGRDGELLLGLVAATPTDEAAAASEAHIAALRHDLSDHTLGRAYLSFCDGEERRARTAEGFADDDLERLRRVKARVDGDDVLSCGLDLTTG